MHYKKAPYNMMDYVIDNVRPVDDIEMTETIERLKRKIIVNKIWKDEQGGNNYERNRPNND